MSRGSTTMVAGVAAAVALLGGGWAWWHAHEAATEASGIRRQSAARRGVIAAQERKISELAGRAEAVEEDNAALAGALRKTQAAVTQADEGSVSREAFAERVKRATTLARSGDPDEAVRELLQCYRLAVAKPSLLREWPQISYLLGVLAKFTESHPEVRAELLRRFEQGKRRVLESTDDTESLGEMGSIARALKDEQLMVAVWDAIPAGDPRRKPVGTYATNGLIATKRYAEALASTSYGVISALFEGNSSRHNASGANNAGRRSWVATTATHIELLAGAGDLVHARELAGRVFAIDGSEATRALVQKHLERAGQPGLLRDAGK